MDFETSYTVERFALKARWEDFPDCVKDRAVMCSLDIIGALILGSLGKQFQCGERLALNAGLKGDIPIIGSRNTYNLLGAAIAMGHSCNSFDIDDGHRLIQGHPGSSFIAGVMAAAADGNVRYTDFLSTLVVCYEMTIRWAMAMQNEYGYLHSTGAYGAFGTALGIGRLIGFDKHQLNNALSIADFHAPMTPVMRSVEYPSMNKDGVSFGALVGTMAVLETLSGCSGKTHILEKNGYAGLLDNLGRDWHILDLYYKPYTCCRWAHQPVKAIIDLRDEYSFRYSDVDKVTVYTFRSATRLSRCVPENTDEAQYNIAWPVACALVYGEVGYLQVRDDAMNDRRVTDMMKRLDFVVDTEIEAQFPGKRLAYVEIRLKNGAYYKSRIYEAPGEPDDPDLNLKWIEDKFRRITEPALMKEAREEIIRLVTDPGSEMGMKDLIIKINTELTKNPK